AACVSLGIITTTVEAAAIILVSHLLFGIPLTASILFSFVLASTSPAVTVPTMIHLQERGRGTTKGIPTMILASASIDNIFCITAFSVASAIVTSADDLLYVSVAVPVELLVAVLIGAVIGVLIRLFPLPDADFVHFSRGTIIASISMALLFGTQAINAGVVGPIAIFVLCVVAAFEWKEDNYKKTRPQERGFKILWDFVFLPFLFALIGLVFDFSM
ncbi:Protein F41E7.2, partial [Aphelenchoides avenae]